MRDAFLVEVSSRDGSRYPSRLGAVIGREDCEIPIADAEVSRRHAAIRGVKEGIAIEDLGSRNGTLVNEERIDGFRVLHDGDQLRVGDTVLRFETAPGSGRPGGDVEGGARGDVPAPEAVPSVIRRTPPLEASGPPAFSRPPRRRIRGSAARRIGATMVSYGVVIGTAVAVVVYFAAR